MDVLVAGAGPAGLAASAHLARQGLSVGCLAPQHPAPWPNNYGVWEDDVAGLGLADCFERRYEQAVVHPSDACRHDLDRAYLRLDNDKLRGRLLAWCDANHVRLFDGYAGKAVFSDTGVVLTDREGNERQATLLVDATGHRAQFVDRGSPTRRGAAQAAYGFVADFDESPIGNDELVLMDFREEFEGGSAPGGAPSFLYAMALDDGRHFVEETSLAHRPALTFDILEERLDQRLLARGVEPGEVDEIEHCLIPMDFALPKLDQRAIGFGAAASMVHPATGYQMAAMLRCAPALAEAVADALGRSDACPHGAARAAWRAIWPEEKVRARELWLFGLESMLALDAAQTRSFFEVFFSLPEAQWRRYMSGTLGPHEIAQVMWSLFRIAPTSLRLALGKTAIGKEGWRMVKTLARS